MERLTKIAQDFFSASHLNKPDSSLIKESSVVGLNTGTRIDETINPIKLKDMLMAEYGQEWITWAPESIVLEAFWGKANDLLLDKVMALQLCLGTDTPWIEWNVFEKVGRCFTNQDVDFFTFQPLSTGECSITMDIMQQIREDEQFSIEANLYVANIAFSEHLLALPMDMFLEDTNIELSKMIYLPEIAKSTLVAWDKVKNLELLDKEFNLEDPVQNQLSKLAVLKQYRKEYYGQ